MNKIIKAEVFKLRHNIGFIILLLVSVIAYGGLNYLSEASADAVTAVQQLSGFAAFIPVFAAVATASIVCDDYQLKTMKNVVSSGVSRANIFFGKYVTSMIATFVMLVLDAIVTIVMCVYFKGFGAHDIAMKQLMINIVLQVVVVLTFNSFSFVIASVLKSSKSTIILSALLYFLDGAIFAGISKLTKIKIINELSLSTVETNIEKFAMNSNELMILVAHVVVALLLLFIALARFKKTEIK